MPLWGPTPHVTGRVCEVPDGHWEETAAATNKRGQEYVVLKLISQFSGHSIEDNVKYYRISS